MNRFKDKTMRSQYAVAVHCFKIKHRDLFRPDGVTRNIGSSFASYFWKGFDNILVFKCPDDKKMIAYAYYRAGQDCAKECK